MENTELKPNSKKEKILTMFERIDSKSVETIVSKILEFCQEDSKYVSKCMDWAKENDIKIDKIKLTPIQLLISTPGGNCYAGMALYDVISSSTTPVEITCSGKVMSMGVIIALSADVRKAYKNTTFMIHQVSDLVWGDLQELEDSIEETKRLNDLLFDIIEKRTKISHRQLDQIKTMKKDWIFSAEEALSMGVITEIIETNS